MALPRRSLAALGLVLGDLLPHLVHVELLHLLDEVLEDGARERARLREEEDLVAEDHDRRDRLDLEHARELGLLLGVDLGESDVGVLLGRLLVRRSEVATRTAPGRPPVDEEGPALLERLLEVLL